MRLADRGWSRLIVLRTGCGPRSQGPRPAEVCQLPWSGEGRGASLGTCLRPTLPRPAAAGWLRAGLYTLSDTRIAVRRQASAPRRWPRSYEAAWSGGRRFHRDRVAELLDLPSQT